MKKLLLTFVMFFTMLVATQSSSFAATKYTGVVNINTATIEEIVLLPGIGKSKGQAILDMRQKKNFTKMEELLLVRGIGENLFAKIKPYITLNGKTTLKKHTE